MKEKMEIWLQENPDATPEDAFKAGWMLCTESWCRGKREKMDQVCELFKDILS